MDFISLIQYLRDLKGFVQTKNGGKLSWYLSLERTRNCIYNIYTTLPETTIKRFFKPPWPKIIIHLINCVHKYNENEFIAAFSEHICLTHELLEFIRESEDEEWALCIMVRLCADLRSIAIQADKEENNEDFPFRMYEQAAEPYVNFFNICVEKYNAANAIYETWAIINLANDLFQMYTRLNKSSYLLSLLHSLENYTLLDQYPMSQRVAFKYYTGRYYLYTDNFKLAAKNLEFAFIHCHKSYFNNKRIILILLTTAKILQGQIPSRLALKKYNIMEFAGLVDAIKSGDIQMFREALEANEDFFIKWKIRSLVDKFQTILLRNLLKIVYTLHESRFIPLRVFQAALNFSMDDDEEFAADSDLVVKDIFQRLVREKKADGYYCEQFRSCILYRDNPFPHLNS